jgi:hypothetical protein
MRMSDGGRGGTSKTERLRRCPLFHYKVSMPGAIALGKEGQKQSISARQTRSLPCDSPKMGCTSMLAIPSGGGTSDAAKE